MGRARARKKFTLFPRTYHHFVSLTPKCVGGRFSRGPIAATLRRAHRAPHDPTQPPSNESSWLGAILSCVQNHG